MSAQQSRLGRLLALVPYFLAHDGISVQQAADDLGVSPTQLIRDLELLFVCGLPGYYPGDLIELEFSEGYVHVGFTAGMDRPLRLTTTEASILLVALRALVDTPGAPDRPAAQRAIAKIEQAVAATPAVAMGAPASPAEDNPTYEALRKATRDGRALRISYYSATRDTVSDRVIDPIRLQVMDHQTYVEAWCRRSDGVRMFRFDRVDGATILDEPAAVPDEATTQQPQTVILRDDPQLPSVDIEIDRDTLWILDYYLIEPLTEPTDESSGAVRARLVYGSPDWLTRFLLGFGGRVRLTDEPELAHRLSATAAAAVKRYEPA